jgi:WD40 repeat protein
VRVWRLADSGPVEDPFAGHFSKAAVAVGALPDGTPVIVSVGDDRAIRVWRLADGAPVGNPITGHTSRALAVGALPDGTPVIVSGDSQGPFVSAYRHGAIQVWRLADGVPVGDPITAHRFGVDAVAVGALPDGTPIIVSGGGTGDGTVRVWRLADGTPVGDPITGHTEAPPVGVRWDGTPIVVVGGGLNAAAVGALPDGTPIMVSGGDEKDCTVRVWRLADRAPVGEPLRLPEGVCGIALHGDTIVTASETAIATHVPPIP